MAETKEIVINRILGNFDQGFACSQSILLGFADSFELDEKTAKLISSTFGGGMGRLRRTCGALTGAYMVLGLKYGNELPTDLDTKLNSYKKVRELTAQFEDVFATSNCKDILMQHASNEQILERKHHKIICREVVGQVAELLYDMIHEESIA